MYGYFIHPRFVTVTLFPLEVTTGYCVPCLQCPPLFWTWFGVSQRLVVKQCLAQFFCHIISVKKPIHVLKKSNWFITIYFMLKGHMDHV